MKKALLVFLICLSAKTYAGTIGFLSAKSSAMGVDFTGGFSARVIDGKFHPAGNIGLSGRFFYNFNAANAIEAGLGIKTIANNTWDYFMNLGLGYVFFAKNQWFFRAGTGVDFSLQSPEFYLTPYIGGGYILGINKSLGMVFSANAEIPVKMQQWSARGVDLTLGIGLIFATKKRGEKNE